MQVLTRCRETGELNAVRTDRSLGYEAPKGCKPDGGISSCGLLPPFPTWNVAMRKTASTWQVEMGVNYA